MGSVDIESVSKEEVVRDSDITDAEHEKFRCKKLDVFELFYDII